VGARLERRCQYKDSARELKDVACMMKMMNVSAA